MSPSMSAVSSSLSPFSTRRCTLRSTPCASRRRFEITNKRTRGNSSISISLLSLSSFSSSSPSKTAALSTSTPPIFTSSSQKVDSFADALFDIQSNLLLAVEELDGSGAKFLREPWTRAEGASSAPGRGLTAVLEGGDLIEKGAASVTHVAGKLSAARAGALSSRGVKGAVEGAPYAAAALSIVFHSRTPHVPTLRGDVRVFSTGEEESASFGGGADLTPFMLYEDDVRAFHAHWKKVCDEAEEAEEGEAEAEATRRNGGGASPSSSSSDSSFYRALKKSCDDYFYIPARKEYRGTGGIFFDGLTTRDGDDGNGNASPSSPSPFSSIDGRAFAESVARNWLPSWLFAVNSRRHLPISDRERQWQLLRRGRYVEFNLLYDRGVKFGLDGGGDADAVMVSAPPLVAWAHRAKAENEREEALMEVLREPRDWA